MLCVATTATRFVNKSKSLFSRYSKETLFFFLVRSLLHFFFCRHLETAHTSSYKHIRFQFSICCSMEFSLKKKRNSKCVTCLIFSTFMLKWKIDSNRSGLQIRQIHFRIQKKKKKKLKHSTRYSWNSSDNIHSILFYSVDGSLKNCNYFSLSLKKK